ncbi:restriction endonuclease subunit S [Ectopseudomonas oleovorans]|uniref:restriction endonuclease subunit S n=1 Tax=Ectopseudomonas oleovorans TaxID=301 RepID=UPI00244C9FA9|nr:restriction endonuclease subunit S [Pseudomonas oleovorans]MDG9979133.1 restriction endonuclease subunit S [Pseudomonas oleovorans]
MSWPFVAIGDVAEILSGNAWKSSQFTNESEGRLPIIRIQNISDIATDFIYWDGVVLEKYIIKDGDLLLSVSGNVKLCEWSFGNALLNQRIVKLAPAACIDKRYFYWALHRVAAEIEAMARHAVIANVSVTDLREFQIPLPPLPEQKRIAAILDKADSVRRKRQQAIQLADDFLRAVFLDMFGDPVTNPKGWAIHKMSDVIDFKGGSQPPKETFEYEEKEGYIRLVQIRDFRTDKFKTYIPESLAKRRFEIDDVMIGRYGPPVFQILRGLSGSYNVALMKAAPKEGVTKDFVYRLLQLPAYQDAVISNSERTAGQTGVNLDLLNSLDVPLPPLDIQILMSERVGKVEELASKLKLDLHDADSLFSSLSQKAFRGEL